MEILSGNIVKFMNHKPISKSNNCCIRSVTVLTIIYYSMYMCMYTLCVCVCVCALNINTPTHLISVAVL